MTKIWQGMGEKPLADAFLPLSRDEILSGLTTQVLGRDIVYRKTIGSTNTLAARLAEAGASDGTLVIADEQTEGRGSRGRAWHSPANRSIYMSVILRPARMLKEPAAFTLVAAVAVARALRRFVPGVQIKWPNDILLDGKKCCGILTETRFEGNQVDFYIVGIGVNVNSKLTDFPPELRSIATSLWEGKPGEPIDRACVVQAILAELETLYPLFLQMGFGAIREAWIEHSVTLGKFVEARFPSKTVSGTAVDLSEDGSLVLLTPEGQKISITSADVFLKSSHKC